MAGLSPNQTGKNPTYYLLLGRSQEGAKVTVSTVVSAICASSLHCIVTAACSSHVHHLYVHWEITALNGPSMQLGPSFFLK